MKLVLKQEKGIIALNSKSQILAVNLSTMLKLVYIVLQLPMRKASREIAFINTTPPEERVELLKPLNDLKQIDDDSEEIYTSGVLKRYCKLPAKLEHLTLADWAAWYDRSGKPYVKPTVELDPDGLPLENTVNNHNDDNDNNDDDDDDNDEVTKQSCSKLKREVKLE